MDIMLAKGKPAIITIAMSAYAYAKGCPNDKKRTYEFCQGYSLGCKTTWNSLAGETSLQQQSQNQGQIVNVKKKKKKRTYSLPGFQEILG